LNSLNEKSQEDRMTIKGPPPKAGAVRRNLPKLEDAVIPRRGKDDTRLYGPDLPLDKMWCPRTKEWYEKWRRSDVAPFLEWSDWESLLETALMHNELWLGLIPPSSVTTYAAEIRRRCSAFGYTYEDRAKLRMHFADVEDAPQAGRDINSANIDYKSLVE
jgi:hypothetical protein